MTYIISLLMLVCSYQEIDRAYKKIITDTVEYGGDKPTSQLLTQFMFFNDSIMVKHLLPLTDKGEWLIKKEPHKPNSIEYFSRTSGETMSVCQLTTNEMDKDGKKITTHFIEIKKMSDKYPIRFRIVYLIDTLPDGRLQEWRYS